MNSINIIIPTYNRPDHLNIILSDIYKNNNNIKINFNIHAIDDGSDSDYKNVINKFKKYENFNYIKSEINSGKNASLFKVFSMLNPSDYVLVIDDKARFEYNLFEIFTYEISNNEIIGIDLFYENGELIGDHLCTEMTMYDFYFKYKFSGDKIWIFKLNNINLVEFNSYIVQNEIAYEDSIWTHFLWKCQIKYVISTKKIRWNYFEKGVSKNIKIHQKNNPITYLNVLEVYFYNLNSKIYKMWYYFLIKKQIKIIKKKLHIKKKFNKFIYSLFYLILYFPLNIYWIFNKY